MKIYQENLHWTCSVENLTINSNAYFFFEKTDTWPVLKDTIKEATDQHTIQEK